MYNLCKLKVKIALHNGVDWEWGKGAVIHGKWAWFFKGNKKSSVLHLGIQRIFL